MMSPMIGYGKYQIVPTTLRLAKIRAKSRPNRLKYYRNIPERFHYAYIPIDSIMFLKMWWVIGKISFHRLIVFLVLKPTGLTLSTDCSVDYGLIANQGLFQESRESSS